MRGITLGSFLKISAGHEGEGRCHEEEEEEDRRESCRTRRCSGGWPYESRPPLRGLKCGRPSLDTVRERDSPSTRASPIAGFWRTDRAVRRQGGRSGLREGNLQTGQKLGRGKSAKLNRGLLRIARPQPEFPNPPARDVTEVRRGGTRVPHALRARHEDLPECEIEVAPLAPVVGKGGGQQRAVERRRRARVDRPSVEPRARPRAPPARVWRMSERVSCAPRMDAI
jgi:hypothetical protein